MPESVCTERFEENGFIGIVNCGEPLYVEEERVGVESIMETTCDGDGDCEIEGKPVCAELYFEGAPVGQTEPFCVGTSDCGTDVAYRNIYATIVCNALRNILSLATVIIVSIYLL